MKYFFFYVILSATANSIELYQNKEYKKASEYFLNLYKENPDNYAIEYNLGHIFFRLSDHAKSIYFFKKSYSHQPRFGDALFNYNYVRKITHEPENIPLSLVDKVPLSLNELLILSLIFSSFFWVLFLMMPSFKRIVLPATIVLISLLSITSIKYFNFYELGIIEEDKSPVFSNPGQDNIVLFSLPVATEVVLLEKYGDSWLKILMPNGKKGWIEKNKIFSMY